MSGIIILFTEGSHQCQILLRLFSLEMPRKLPFVVPLLAEAQQFLQLVKNDTIPPPAEDSSARHAFDPRITRHLHSIMPMRPLTIPPQEEAWKVVEGLLDGWETVYRLSTCESLLAWNVTIITLMPMSFTKSGLC